MTYTKENAKEYGAMGGRQSTIAKKLAKRRYCSPSCPIFDKCPLMPMAQSQWTQTPKGEKRHPCLLSTLPLNLQRRIRRLFLGDRDGLIEELKDVLYNLSTLTDGNPKELTKYGELILKAITTIYGQKVQEEGTRDININVRVVDGEQ